MPLYDSHSEDDTGAIATALAAKAMPGDVFLLNGTLGAGKSVFARAFVKSLAGEDTEVPSPTFTLLQTYNGKASTIWHYDLYRLQDPDDIFELDWDSAVHDGIVLVEWPERLGPHTPAKARTIEIAIFDNAHRTIRIDD